MTTAPMKPDAQNDSQAEHDDDALLESYLVETTDEEGNTHLFEKLDEFELENQRYALLLYMGEQEEGGTLAQAAAQLSEKLANAAQEDEEHEHGPNCNHDHGEADDEELVVMRITAGDDGADWYEEIETDEEYEKVVAYVEQRHNNGELPFGIDIEDDEDE